MHDHKRSAFLHARKAKFAGLAILSRLEIALNYLRKTKREETAAIESLSNVDADGLRGKFSAIGHQPSLHLIHD